MTFFFKENGSDKSQSTTVANTCNKGVSIGSECLRHVKKQHENCPPKALHGDHFGQISPQLAASSLYELDLTLYMNTLWPYFDQMPSYQAILKITLYPTPPTPHTCDLDVSSPCFLIWPHLRIGFSTCEGDIGEESVGALTKQPRK